MSCTAIRGHPISCAPRSPGSSNGTRWSRGILSGCGWIDEVAGVPVQALLVYEESIQKDSMPYRLRRELHCGFGCSPGPGSGSKCNRLGAVRGAPGAAGFPKELHPYPMTEQAARARLQDIAREHIEGKVHYEILIRTG